VSVGLSSFGAVFFGYLYGCVGVFFFFWGGGGVWGMTLVVTPTPHARTYNRRNHMSYNFQFVFRET